MIQLRALSGHQRRPLARLVSIAALACSSMSQAQMLEEIVVTAQKRAENLQEVPVSVSAISGSAVEMFRFRDAADITAQIPNLQATTTAGDGFPIFSLRGVAMNDFSFNQASPVASYVDEVYKGNPAIQGVQIFDLERIEVLRGPQGTLYGKNSTGGAVNFITRKPSFEGSNGYITVGLGDYSRKEASGAFETDLVEDVLAMRLAGTWTEVDGWFENKNPGVDDANAVDEYGVRLSIAWRPTDSLEAIVRYTKTDQEAVNYGIQPQNIEEIGTGVGGGLYGLYNALGVSDQTDYFRENLDYREMESNSDRKRELSNDGVSVTVNWDLSDQYSLTSITSWDDGDIYNPEDADGSTLRVLEPTYSGDATQYTQDLRITSDLDGAFNFIAGVYGSKEEISNATNIGFWQDVDMNADGNLEFLDCADVVSVTFFGGAATPSGAAMEDTLNGLGLSMADFAPAGCQFDNEFDQDRTSYAAYFDGNYALNNSWTLRAGLRYTNDKTELSNFSARILGSDGTPVANTIPGDPVDPYAKVADQDFSDDEWTGKIGIDYMSESGMLVYASASHGYRSGAYNAQAFQDPSELTQVDPEELDAFEVGIKHELMDGRVRLNGAAFFYTYENQQFINVDSATLAQTLINIEESEIKGLELELDAALLENLTIQAGLGYLDTEVTDGVLSGIDLEGNKLILAPELNFNLAVNWDIARTKICTIGLNASATYVDDFYFDVFNTDRFAQDGYWLSNARLQLTGNEENWHVAGWVKNLGDEEYATSAIDLSDFGFDYAHIGAPRTYGIELRYDF
jgi:iron complex outermembrane receptor protein